MADEVSIRMRLRDMRKFLNDNKQAAKAVGQTGKSAEKAGRDARKGGRGFDLFTRSAGKGGSKGVAAMRKAAKAASALALAYVGLSGAKKALDVTTQLAKSTLTLSRSFGLTTEEASAWAAQAQVRGSDGKALTMGFKALATQSRNAAKGGKQQIDTFKELGITQDELTEKGDSLHWLLRAVAKGMGDLPTGTNKAGISAKLFGRTWTTISPLIRSGTKEMDAQLAMAKKYGATFSGGSIKSMEDYIKAQREAKLATLGLQVSFGTQLAPQLTKVIPIFAQFVAEMRNGTGTGGKVAKTIKQIVGVTIKLVEWGAKIGKYFVDQFKESKREALLWRDAWRNAVSWVKRAFGNAMSAIVRGFAVLFEQAAKLPFVGKKFRGLAAGAREAADKLDALGEKESYVNRKAREAATGIDDLTKKLQGLKPFTNQELNIIVQGASPLGPIDKAKPPGQALGGITRRPGWSLVGEKGPELLDLPRHARVTPLSSSRMNGRAMPAVAPSPRSRGDHSDGGEHHHHLYLDGKELNIGIGRAAAAAKARK